MSEPYANVEPGKPPDFGGPVHVDDLPEPTDKTKLDPKPPDAQDEPPRQP